MRSAIVRGVLAAGVSACLALTGCGKPSEAGDSARASDSGSAKQVNVLLDWAPNPDHLALFTAQHMGAYDEAGVDVTFTTPANTSDAAREVSLGRADLAVSYEPDTIIAREGGLDVISVAALIPTALTSFVAKSESGISSAADFEGKTIAISGLTSQEPTIRYIAKKTGIDAESISMPNVQQNINQALLTDQVDAIFGAFRNIDAVELAQKADVNVLSVTDLGVPDYSELVIIANPTRLAEDGDYAARVRAFLAGTASGQKQAVADPHKALESLMPETEGSYDQELLEKMIDTTVRLLPADGFGTQEKSDWAVYAKWMYDNRLLETEIDGAQATTNEYLG